MAGEDEGRFSVPAFYARLAQHRERNALIVQDVRQAIAEGRSPIVLTGHRDHIELMRRELEGLVPRFVVLCGGLGSTRCS